MPDFNELYSLDLVHALVDCGGNILDIARAFERGYGHLSQEMLSIAGYPQLESNQARKLFEALHVMADFAFSFSEFDFLHIPFAGGKSLIERAGVRRRGRYRRYRSLYSAGTWEFDEHIILTELKSRVFIIANGASEKTRSVYPAGAYVSVGPMSKSEMRSVGQTEILDTSKFIPIARMLEGKDREEAAIAVEALSLAMQLLMRDRKTFQHWMLHPLGGLSALVAFQRERLRRKKRRPFLIARYADLSHRNLNAFSYRKPVVATLDKLDRICREYEPPSWKDWKEKRDEVIDGEKIFNALLFNASFLFTNFVLAKSKYGDRVPLGWGLKPQTSTSVASKRPRR